TLNYDFAKVINNDDHSLTALLGQELTITKSNLLTMMVDGFDPTYNAEAAWNFMSAASNPASTNNYVDPDDKLLSFFGRVNY
ncbi:hypothetical protein, partial [Klebsiella pneumoniae]|uniref:hypothetical protein n=1 Tax=Klebsiella pneumoniae TaxID=573 RepID=UPI0025A29CC1